MSPVLVQVIVCGALVEFAGSFPKSSAAGVKRNCGPVAPVPVNVTICCEPIGSLSEIFRVPVK